MKPMNNQDYETLIQKAITEPSNLSREEKDRILSHRMTTTEASERIQEINSPPLVEETTTLILTIGVSGSGKSTYSTEKIKEDKSFLRINRDDIRKMLRGTLDGYYQQDKSVLSKLENYISDLESLLIAQNATRGYSSILDNTHLRPVYVEKWVEFVKFWNNTTGSKIDLKFKIFPEDNLFLLKKRINIRDTPLSWSSMDYIDAQVKSLKTIIPYIESNYKDQIIN